MALQGTIETFALPDVLRLLASTKKTGHLRLNGDRGNGALWLADGAIVSGEASSAPRADAPVDVVYELLRFHDGEFVFEDGDAPSGDLRADVESTLGDAEALVAEWREIEAVVPSGASWVSLAATLPNDEVTIDADRWKAIVAIGGGTSVDQLGAGLELGELAAARLVKGLVEEDLVEVGEAPADAVLPTPPTSPDGGGPSSTVSEPALASTTSESMSESTSFDPSGLVIEDTGGGTAPAPAPAAEPSATSEPSGGGLQSALSQAEPGEAAEIARQLANLSPKAARAVAAAAKATTPEEREAALAEVEEGDDQINRELLLKFLGSVQ